MALETTENRKEYAGNGVTLAFAFPYYFLAEADLVVILRNDTTGVETPQVITTNYTITGEGEEAGGTVTMLAAPAAGNTLVIYRDPEITQGTDFRENDSFPAEEAEKAWDRAAMISQRQAERIDRSVRVSEGFVLSDFDLTLPPDLKTDSAGKVIIINDTEDGFVMGPTADTIEAASDDAAAAAASAAAADASEALAQDWANKTNGSVDGSEFSSKAYAVGGTGITDTVNKGAAKEWANKTTAAVDTSEYSAKEYAQGTQVGTGGSAKDWASKTSAAVSGSEYSAKEWARGTQTRGAANGGAAKDWANYTGGTVDNTEYSAKKYAVDAAASALAAANTLASALWRGMRRKTSADSPYTITQADNGYLIVVDTTAGAVTMNLPSVAGLSLPFTVGIQLDAGANNITVNRNGTDTIDGSTSKTISVAGAGAQFLADINPTPDEWEVMDFGAAGGNLIVDAFSGTGAQTAFVLSADPGSKNNTWVSIDGVLQQKSSYSVSGTTLTFTTAPPTGTSNIEVVTGTTLSIGTPSDNTVTNAKLVNSTIASSKTNFTLPTVQKFTSGSSTYTTPAGVKWIRVRAVGGGGGGASSGTAGTVNGGTGGNTTFGSSLLVANGGGGGSKDTGYGGAGGTASLGTGPIGTALMGGQGSAQGLNVTNVIIFGGMGSSSPFGGNGAGGYNGSGVAAVANTGSGGGGGGTSTLTGTASGAGGGSGGYVDAIIHSPSSTYAYAVGAGGTAGTAGTNGYAGGAGGSGYIIVEEYYQ